ncbi:Monensin polyketide synthase putative ketoacyl reductase [Colletotrichum tanaceti]|nr:Monensin polyketide synthase putative ketoacyl reductase [Colletotrichum tanaceti]
MPRRAVPETPGGLYPSDTTYPLPQRPDQIVFFNISLGTLFIPPSAIDPVGFVSGVRSRCGGVDYGLIQEAWIKAGSTSIKPMVPGLARTACRLTKIGVRIDLLVNAVGVMNSFSSVDGLTDTEWERVTAVNLTVPVRMIRAVILFTREKKSGAIVNIASTAGTSGAVAGIAYTCSKHDLIGETKNVAWRFRKEGIQYNAVLPGAVDSGIEMAIAAGHGYEYDAEACAQVEPDHELHAQASELAINITPLEVPQAVVSLATDQTRTINGVSLPIDLARDFLAGVHLTRIVSKCLAT